MHVADVAVGKITVKINPAAVHRFGLYDVSVDKPRLSGVAVFGVPVSPAVLTKALPELEPSAHG